MHLSKFTRELLLSYYHQVTYIYFQRSGASNGYTGLFIVYVIASPDYSYELGLTVFTDGHHKVTTASDVLGRASSSEPAEPSPSKPKPSPALTRACSGLGPGFRFRKPKPGAQARASTPCGLVRDPRLEV